MGITSFSLTLIEKAVTLCNPKCYLDLGDQNLYDKDYGGIFPYASEYFEAKGIKYTCIDINGNNNAIVHDMATPTKIKETFDMLGDFGFSEHVGINGKHDPIAFYNCWKTKHNLCKLNGVIISENPKTGNWPQHGFNYVTEDFYKELAKLAGYEILELGQHPAMGNITDGWNIYCILIKKQGEFISFNQFKKLSFFDK